MTTSSSIELRYIKFLRPFSLLSPKGKFISIIYRDSHLTIGVLPEKRKSILITG